MKLITLDVTNFTSTAKIIEAVNEAVQGKTVNSIHFDKVSAIKGVVLIAVDEPVKETKIVNKFVKFKDNTTSEFYCVYYDKSRGNWCWSFRNSKLDKKRFTGTGYKSEIEAALAYDKARYEIEGDLSKLNFPEHYEK